MPTVIHRYSGAAYSHNRIMTSTLRLFHHKMRSCLYQCYCNEDNWDVHPYMDRYIPPICSPANPPNAASVVSRDGKWRPVRRHSNAYISLFTDARPLTAVFTASRLFFYASRYIQDICRYIYNWLFFRKTVSPGSTSQHTVRTTYQSPICYEVYILKLQAPRLYQNFIRVSHKLLFNKRLH